MSFPSLSLFAFSHDLSIMSSNSPQTLSINIEWLDLSSCKTQTEPSLSVVQPPNITRGPPLIEEDLSIVHYVPFSTRLYSTIIY